MMQKTQTPQDWSVPMPITQESHQIARQFANEQPTQEKALQVYLNTLAVCSVNNYLRIMDISTDLTASDSWNPVVRLAADVADLWITGLGRLECRSVQATEPDIKGTQTPNHLPWLRFISSKPTSEQKSTPVFCYVPPEVQFDRIGYVVVQIDSEQQEATLLGFSQTAGSGQLVISQLQSINDMLKHLENYRALPLAPVNLSQWLQDIFDDGWQSVESLWNEQKANYAFRRKIANSIRRAKPIQLETQLDKPTVALTVTLTQHQATDVEITLQLLPLEGETYLPAGLTLTVLDELEETFLEVSSGNSDRFVQTRPFGGQSGERFRVQISLGEDSIAEDFTI
jgi:hypothetical protein